MCKPLSLYYNVYLPSPILYYTILPTINCRFHVLALVVMFFLLVFLMVRCVRVYELPAYSRGLLSINQPRSVPILCVRYIVCIIYCVIP
jgi:hypothetical protein